MPLLSPPVTIKSLLSYDDYSSIYVHFSTLLGCGKNQRVIRKFEEVSPLIIIELRRSFHMSSSSERENRLSSLGRKLGQREVKISSTKRSPAHCIIAFQIGFSSL
jgi:hypothetical protein